MKGQTKCVIEGQVKSTARINFKEVRLAVHAFLEGIEVGHANVDSEGKYKLSFTLDGKPTATELRLIPAELSYRCSRTPALAKTLNPNRYVLQKRSAEAYRVYYDFKIPRNWVNLLTRAKKKYSMHGTVWATTFVGNSIQNVDPLPSAKIEFYEIDAVGPTPEEYLGNTITDTEGEYSFNFKFASVFTWLFYDTMPDIRARISQFVGGIWRHIYESPVDWNIAQDFDRDYFVDVNDIFPTPDPGIKPAQGFRFSSVGLLPIDTSRISKGYATAKPGDPSRIFGISHQPFCGQLRIFGYFAEVLQVATYKVQIADADENGATGSWRDVNDALYNQRLNSATNVYEPVVLGPDQATGRYRNIDIEPVENWHEHELKVTWNSANEPNGYYALRIIGYKADGSQAGVFEMPVVFRVDNDPPEVSIEPLDTSTCGDLSLPASREIHFKITAHSPEGHVLRYKITGTRGKDKPEAGNSIVVHRPSKDANWNGVKDYAERFDVSTLPAELVHCAAVAYNFELHVTGSATDCYDVTPGSQIVEDETNLVISEV